MIYSSFYSLAHSYRTSTMNRDANFATRLRPPAITIHDDCRVDRRNAAWMPVIAEASATPDRLVVAAGAAHLIGEGGVLARLQNDGWAIAPYLP